MWTQISIDNRPRFAYDLARHRRVGRSSFLTGYRHLFGILLAIALVFLQGAFCAPAEADEFPGKGSRDAWRRANDLYNEANALSSNKNHDQAISKYQSAIALYPFENSYFQNLGQAYERKGELRLAETAFRRAIALDSKYWAPWNGLKNVLYKMGRYSESKSACEKALECNPPPSYRESILRAIDELNRRTKLSTTPNP